MDDMRGIHKTVLGKVVSDKMDKTIVVSITRQYIHPTYKKYVRRTLRYKAHDEANVCGIGDTVEIIETRPLSKSKRWRLVWIVEKAI
jgi:small subunit ribosomal protein S17